MKKIVLLISIIVLASGICIAQTTFTVTSAADAGGTCPGANCTLRQAIATAASGDTINFDAGISVITLTSDELVVNKSLTFSGPGANLLTVQRSNAANNFRIFNLVSGSVTFSGMTIANGKRVTYPDSSGDYGGGIFHTEGVLTINGCVISGNKAIWDGGGIYNASGTVTVINSTISDNSSAVLNESCGPSCTLSSAGWGGGLYNSSGTMTIVGSTISGNFAGVGGGVFNEAALTVDNSTISGNTSRHYGAGHGGGGIWNYDSALAIITNSTIVGNVVIREPTGFGGAGGGIFNEGTVIAGNTIIASNTTEGNSLSPDFGGILTSQGFNLIGDAANGTTITGNTTGNQLNVDPLLGPLQNNGGPTMTRALLLGSTAIDRGDSGGFSTDQRGFTRPIDLPAIPNGAGDGSDIGAFEAQTASTPTSTATSTLTWTPTPTAPPTLGNYANTLVQLGANTTIIPDTAPTNASYLTVAASTNFKGKLEGDPITGVVRITNAHPAGVYTVTVTAFNGAGASSTATFTLTVGTPATCNPVNFTSAANFGVGTQPRSMAVADFDRDGKQDLVTVNENSNDVTLLLGDGAGSFVFPTFSSVGTDPRAVAVGDFNRDGNPDIAVASAGTLDVSILLGNGAGRFLQADFFSTTYAPVAITVGDFNNDGKQDLVTVSENSNTMSILLGTGTGNFGAAATFSVGDAPRSVAIGDFNNDGNQDIATASYGSNTASVSLGNGTGSFGTAANFGVGSQPTSITVGDFNGDGIQDLATANYSGNTVSILLGTGTWSRAMTNFPLDTASILLGGGGGSPFVPAANFAAGFLPSSLAVGDFNGDSILDLVVTNSGSSVSILLGNGPGSFDAPTSFGVGSSPFSVVVGDFNADGKQDIASANFGSNNVSVLLRQCAPTALTISAVPVIRTAGAGASNSTIANVSDPVDPLNTLTVTVNGGSSATQNGVTVNNISISVAGVVTANVAAATGASDASFTLTVTNSAMLSATSTLPVIVLSSCPGSGTWTQQANVTASDSKSYAEFGYSVAISGDTVIVGADADDTPGALRSGSAYIFTRSGSVWTQQQKLTASDGTTSIHFGASVAISGDTAIVGAPYNGDTHVGKAYIFTRSGSVWTQQQKLTASDGEEFDAFGISVAISSDTVIVGASGDDTTGGTDAGSAYIFTRSDSVWTQQQKLTASDSVANDIFGYSVAISGDTTIVGALYNDTMAGENTGAAYIFTRSGTVWTQQQKLTASDGEANDFFGSSVAISGDVTIVGAYDDSIAGSLAVGSAYIFIRNGTIWTQQQKLTASDGVAQDVFGGRVAISGNTVMVGAASSDYIFTRSGSVWTQQQEITTHNGGFAVNGDTAIFGAPFDNLGGGYHSGSSYMFTRNCSGPTPTLTKTPTATPTATPPQSCIPNLISWWPGESNALDVVSHNDGTLQNGVGFAAGEVGQAFSFDGTDDAVFVGNPASLNVTSAITIEAWVNTNSFPDGTITNVVAKWGFDATVDSYLLGLINTGGVIHAFGAIGDGVTGDPGVSGGSVSTNTWTHLAMTYDAANGANRLYLNGAEVASRVRNGGIYPTATNVYIGREDSAQGRWFNGLIDEPSVYNRALSAAEIQAIYNAGSAGKCSSSSTSTPTAMPTSTPTNTPTPSLGNYANTTVQLAANTTITPDAAPTGITRLTVATSTNFKGKLEGNPTTGIVRVTDAHPAGVYTVTVKAFTSGGATTTKTFSLTVTTPPTCNPVTFAPAANYDVGTYPRSVAVGDFNGDSKQDVVSTNEASNSVSVLLGNGTGGFGAATNFPVGSQPESVVVGDFNGDGQQDIAATNGGAASVSILLGDGTGQFTTASGIAIGQQPYSIAVGDFNDDGKQDLAAANLNSDSVSVSLGDGAGGFSAAVNLPVGHGPRSVVVADLNNDGKQDIVTGNQYAGNVSILLGDGTGAFAALQSFGNGVNAHSVAVGDFNGDGKQDLATANRDAGTVSILSGNGLGGFSAQTDLNGVSLPNSVAVGDFNGDGKQDLVVGNFASASVWLFLGNGLGGFGPPTSFGAGSNLFTVAVGDFNGDGLQDIVTDSFTSSVSVLLRQCVYANTSVQLGANTTITPSATPANAARLTVATSTSFKGKLEGNPTTGVVRVTDAHPAGVFPVTVTAFTGAGASTTSTFTLTVTTPASCNQATFAAAATVPVGGNPTSVAIGDFNGDGKQDYAVSNFGGYVSIVLGNGTGGFSAPTNFNVGALPFWVAIGDFNGDGKQDLVTANYNSSNVSVLLGNGAGSFSSQTVFPIGTAPESVAVGDFNGDGKQDLVTANSGTTYVSVLLGDGAGSFSAPTNFPVPNNPPSVVVGDFNGDGNQDLATNEASTLAVILLGNGTGSFGGAGYYGAGNTSFAMTIGDFNGDGNQDLASTTSSSVGILLGNGAGAFSGSGVILAGSFPKSVAVGDFDNDGDQDIVTANKNSNNVALLLGNGAGSFGAAADSPYAVGSSPNSVAVGDFNGDDRLDLVAANSSSGNLSVLMRQCSAPTNTPTATATQTNTPTATPTGSVVITGTVTYGNAVSGPPPPRFVSNVLISGVGSFAVSTLTNFPGGNYSLSGFGAGSYTVTPTKTGGVNGAIGSFDAARIAQHAAGPPLPQLSGNQLVVADVSNNGMITSFDAGEVAKFAAGPPYTAPGIGLTGSWKFSPLSKNYPSVVASLTGEDYSALLMGEVSGNWANTGARAANGPERSIAVTVPKLVTPADDVVLIPVAVQGAVDKGIISYEFDLRYDPSVIQPQADPVDLAGTVSRGLSAVANPNEPGLLRVVMYGPLPIEGNGVLLNLRFTAVGAPGTVSPLTFERIMFNEGDPGTLVTDGQVELSAAAPDQAEISGRLLTAFGAGVPNSRVTLSDSTGQSRSIVSNGFGFYRFGGLQIGQTYTISVESGHYAFTPLTVSVTDHVVNVGMIAEP